MLKTKEKKIPTSDKFTLLARKFLGVEVVREFKFHQLRNWRYDYAIPEYKIALEVEGGVWTNGRHTRGKGFLGDIEKYNTGTMLGWRIFRTIPTELCTTLTLQMLASAIKKINTDEKQQEQQPR